MEAKSSGAEFKRSRFPGQNRVAENGDGQVRAARDEASVDAIDTDGELSTNVANRRSIGETQAASAEPDRLTPGGYLANGALAMRPYVHGAECIRTPKCGTRVATGSQNCESTCGRQGGSC